MISSTSITSCEKTDVFPKDEKRDLNFWQKPTLEYTYISLRNLRLFCQGFEIQNLAMPKIGSGLDQLDWPTVLRMTKYIFKNSEINIQIFSKQCVFELDKQKIISEHQLAVFGGHNGINQIVK